MNKNTFAYFLMSYFSEYLPNQIGASKNTIQSYRDTFLQLLQYYKEVLHILPEKLTYDTFTAERIEAFLNWLEEIRGIAITTRNQRLAAIHAFFRYLQYRDPTGFVQCSEVLSVPFKKAPTGTVSYMTIEEITLLFSLPNVKERTGLRDLTIMTLLYESGARVQELIDLCPKHIRFQSTNTILLHGKGNKSRQVPISADVAKIVKRYLKEYQEINDTTPLFTNRQGEKMTRAGIQYVIDKYVSLGKEQRPDLFRDRITNHSFRHSKAMHLLEAGVNLIYIRDLLGHTSVTTTEIYARSNPKVKEKQLEKNSATIKAPSQYSQKEKNDLTNWLKKNL